MHVTGTTPYPWPFDGDLDGTRTALLVVLPAGDCELAAPVGPLASAVQAAGGRVIVVRTTAPAPDPAAGPHPHGLTADLEMQAGGVDGFYASDLDLVLRTGRTRRLVVVGVGLETCVHSTLRDANDRGYECLLVVDACVPIDPDLVAASISSIEMSGGIFGAVGYSTDVVEALAPQPALR